MGMSDKDSLIPSFPPSKRRRYSKDDQVDNILTDSLCSIWWKRESSHREITGVLHPVRINLKKLLYPVKRKTRTLRLPILAVVFPEFEVIRDKKRNSVNPQTPMMEINESLQRQKETLKVMMPNPRVNLPRTSKRQSRLGRH
jgi:hypothetical protein